jgi:hypothetical protein
MLQIFMLRELLDMSSATERLCVDVLGQRPTAVRVAPLFCCVSRVLTLPLWLTFVLEAAGYFSHSQLLVVAWRNLVTYLSVEMSHKYLVRCCHRTIILLKTSLP